LKNKKSLWSGVLVFLLISALRLNSLALEVDPGIGDYERTNGVSGNLSSVGSDTLANLMTLWAESFKKFYPTVNIQIQVAGSSTAPPALTEGTSNLGPMSRKMKSKENDAFEAKFGYKATPVPVAIDALAVFVHKDNPINKGLDIKQVDAIFSTTRKCYHGSDIATWGDVGLSGSLASQTIQLYGRNSVSGTYGYFKKEALCKGDYKDNINEQPGSASVVQGVTKSANGIGYSGIGYRTSGVRAIALSKKGSALIPATPEAVVSGEYPLGRFLWAYLNKAPNRSLPPIEREFVKMVLSNEGQQVVIKDGYIPLPASVVTTQLELIN